MRIWKQEQPRGICQNFINCFKLVKGKSDILQMPDSDKSDTSPPDGYILKIDNETVIKNKIK